MYNFKINKETKELEVIKEQMNIHPSIIDKFSFDGVFTREYARFEYFSLLAKIENGTNTAEDEIKYKLLISEGHDFSRNECCTNLTDLHEAIKPLMILTLYAHGKLLKSYEKDKDNDYKIKSEKLSLGLSDFYKTCHENILGVESGRLSIEEAVKTIKPLYNEATKIINHESVENVCKKWEESTKEKMTRAFVIGLLSRYKLTRSNRIKAESPLKSQANFEKYFSMWLVTGGAMVDTKKQDKKTVETFSSFCNRK